MTSDEHDHHGCERDGERWLRDGLERLAAAGAARPADSVATAGTVASLADASVPPERAGRRSRSTALAAAAVVVLLLGASSVMLTHRTTTVDDDLTTSDAPSDTPSIPEPGTRPADPPGTTPPSAPTAEPPRWSTSAVCTHDANAGPFFEGVELPPGLDLVYAPRDCAVLGEPTFREDWYDGDPFVEGTRRISLMRIEQRAAGSAVGSGRSSEWTTVNGKPAEVLGNEVPTENPQLTIVSWEQDANGGAQVVAEGYDLATVIAIAESFDRAVAREGPRNAALPISRAQAADRAGLITGSLSGIGEPTLARTTPTALAAAGGPVVPAEALAGERPIWVVTAEVSGDIPAPFGNPGDRWGALVLDAADGRVLTTVTGGADGSTRPGWIDGLEDEAAVADPP